MNLHNPPVHPKDESAEVYLIDGSAYVYRAFHAVRGLTNSSGLPTNAVFGFTRMLIKLIQERKPRYVAMFFDAKGPTFRHELYAEYKANRPPMPEELAAQLPYIKQVTDGFNIPVVEMSGYEADDLIGAYARRVESLGLRAVMVTGDKDYMQLVTERVTIWDPMKDKVVDADRIYESFALNPSQLIDMMGLAGDTADNVPGVPGIGPKTAMKLIQTFGDMETLYARIDDIPAAGQREKLARYREQAFLSRSLVTIDTGAPVAFTLEALKVRPPDAAALGDLFQTLEFRQLQHDFQQIRAEKPTAYKTVLTWDELKDVIARLEAAACFALDTETTSQNPMAADLVGLSVCVAPYEAFYIPVGHRYFGAPDQLPRDRVLESLQKVFGNPRIAKVGQNIKYDWVVLKRHGVALAGVSFDTMLASYLLNPSKRAHNLDQIALDFLGHKTITYSEVAGKGKNAVTFDQVTLEKAAPYACEDADITLRAFHALKPLLDELDLMPLMTDVEMPLAPVLMDMEMAGVCVDLDRLRVLSKSFQQQLLQLETEIHSLAGERFNIQSSQQLGRVLFEKLHLPTVKKTKKKTGYSTDVDVLTKLAEHHELPAFILRHRTLAKLKSTYVDGLIAQADPRTGRIHTSFNQTVTATGRLSSSDPNLQNIPIRTEEGREIRKAFVAPPGCVLMAADYSQIELRLLAHVAADDILLEAFKNDQDIHARTAAEVFQTPVDQVSAELRRQAKVINFGIIYGMSAFGLSKELGINPKMAQTYIDHYFERYKGVRAYMQKTVAQARETRRTATLLGRLRLLPDISAKNPTVRGFAERTAINTPIQGSAADLIKLAMIQMDDALKQRGLRTRMILSVHDEIVFEVPEAELAAMERLAKEVMENVWRLDAPLKVNVAWGPNWAQAH